MVEDDQGGIWIASPASGIARIEHRDSATFTIQEITKANGLPDNYVSTLKKDRLGRIWFATNYGRVGYFEKGKIIAVYDTKNGLPQGSISAITFDENNNVWLGTSGFGVYQQVESDSSFKFLAITYNDQLKSGNIYSILFDDDGNLWAGSERGVDKISITENVVVNVQHFGKK